MKAQVRFLTGLQVSLMVSAERQAELLQHFLSAIDATAAVSNKRLKYIDVPSSAEIKRFLL